MSIHTILSQMDESFNKEFIDWGLEAYYWEPIRKFIRSFATRIMEEVGEELESMKKDILFNEDYKVLNLNMVNPVFAIITYKYFGEEKKSITNIVENEFISREIVEWARLNNEKEYTSEVFDAKVFRWSDMAEKYTDYKKPTFANNVTGYNQALSDICTKLQKMKG